MAWKFRQEYVRDGDVVEPSDLRINVNEFVSEFNGYLDSDNLARQAISVPFTERETFTAVFSNDLNPAQSYIFNHRNSGWIRESQISLNRDLIVTTVTSDPAASIGYETDPSSLAVARLPSITFRPDSDGLLICEFSGFVKWMNSFSDSLETTSQQDVNQYSYFARQTKYYKNFNALVLCSMWRMTVNGQSVAETGPLGNEYQAHPIYLCGTTPVLKNEETIVQLEAQFVWYGPGTDAMIQASSFEALGVDSIPYRNDCSLNCPMLITTFRKR